MRLETPLARSPFWRKCSVPPATSPDTDHRRPRRSPATTTFTRRHPLITTTRLRNQASEMCVVTGSWMVDALLVVLPLAYWYRRCNFFFWEKLGVPYLKPTSFLGNMGGMAIGEQHAGDPIYDCYLEAADAPFMGMFAFGNPLLMVKDPELLSRVLVTDFPAFNSRNFAVGSDSLLTKSVLGANGDRWETLRTKLAPIFTPGKIKAMFPLMEGVGQDLVQHLAAEVEKGEAIDVWQVMARYTAHVLCTIVLGADAGSMSEAKSPMTEHVMGLTRKDVLAQLSLAISLLAPQLFKLFPLTFTSEREETLLYFSNVQMMNERRQKGIVRADMVDTLMQLRTSANKKQSKSGANRKSSAGTNHMEMDDETIVGNIVAFLIGGLDTSVSTMTYALYQLAVNQQIQDKVRLDIREAIFRHGGEFTYQALGAMNRLDCVINETMRLYPPMNFLDRKTTQPFRIPGTDIVLPKDTGIVVSVLGLHHDPRYWEHPERFLPGRFSGEGGKARPSHTFLPFGDGPRQCPGLRMAHTQMKIALANVLINFRVSVTEKTPVPQAANRRKLIRKSEGSFELAFEKVS
ncbi:cytochrome P450 6k1-like [Schistocerca serialis cubense]|uniref:cytochrome P450 6k1-like n=1 Tax=Schistocerca serialis cubense TaxID=2023355 RepID=UPI00214E71E4|nr:cytochrome P450 6k1-like [Schistocerca serialis cubense]